jgi:hypothetical protein
MYSVAAGAPNSRLSLATIIFLLWMVQIGSAQSVITGHVFSGYARSMDEAFLSNIPAPALIGVDAAGEPLSSDLHDSPPTRTAIDSSKEMFQPLPNETTDNIPLRSGDVTFDGVDLTTTSAALHRALLRRPSQARQDQAPTDSSDDEPWVGERYHWGGLIGQSLFFNVIENTFRSASDDQIRVLLANKPFWHDYIASIHQFNMRRWNDGDDFLVNYVGHPMQGAVSGFIEIQNDPAGREQEISATHAYWMSRFKAFLWATAYSTHSEISPLGEAGIGNEGGWTYPIHCRTTRCTEPGTYKKYTNNTGWVDFIITPTVGSLWLLAEDTLDRFVSDRVQGGNRSRILPKILRGGLNPSRTMANALRFKAPWYRDFQHSPELEGSYGIHVLPSDESIREAQNEAQNFRRFAVMPYFIAMPLGTAAHPCTVCMQNPGAGVQADLALTRWMAVSFAASKQQDVIDKEATTNGSTVNTGLGLRLIYDRPGNALSLAVRPGLVTEHALISSNINSIHNNSLEPSESSVSHMATTIMFSNDYKISGSVALRSSFGATIVRYRNAVQTPAGIGKPPYLSWLSHDSYTNRSTWTYEMGPVFHF